MVTLVAPAIAMVKRAHKADPNVGVSSPNDYVL
jgi:hypothetical protein